MSRHPQLKPCKMCKKTRVCRDNKHCCDCLLKIKYRTKSGK